MLSRSIMTAAAEALRVRVGGVQNGAPKKNAATAVRHIRHIGMRRRAAAESGEI
jgi:hypothetical protein